MSKKCVQTIEEPADSLWANLHKTPSFTQLEVQQHTGHGQNHRLSTSLLTHSSTKLYTKITQRLLLLRGQFYTVSTWPITITTIYINKEGTRI